MIFYSLTLFAKFSFVVNDQIRFSVSHMNNLKQDPIHHKLYVPYIAINVRASRTIEKAKTATTALHIYICVAICMNYRVGLNE